MPLARVQARPARIMVETVQQIVFSMSPKERFWSFCPLESIIGATFWKIQNGMRPQRCIVSKPLFFFLAFFTVPCSHLVIFRSLQCMANCASDELATVCKANKNEFATHIQRTLGHTVIMAQHVISVQHGSKVAESACPPACKPFLADAASDVGRKPSQIVFPNHYSSDDSAIFFQ